MIITPNGHKTVNMFSAWPHIKGIYLLHYYPAFEKPSKDPLAISEKMQKKQY